MFGKGSFDVVSVNPPYMPAGRGLANPGDEKAIARHEILCTLADVCAQAAAVLKDGGHFSWSTGPEGSRIYSKS